MRRLKVATQYKRLKDCYFISKKKRSRKWGRQEEEVEEERDNVFIPSNKNHQLQRIHSPENIQKIRR